MASGSDTTKVAAEKIDTFFGWAADVLDGCGIDFRISGKYADKKNVIIRKLSELSEDQVEDNSLDALLLDECQDYTVDEINLMSRFARRVFAAGDSRQRIYHSRGAIERLKEICGNTSTLTYHYRNGVKICRVADGITNLVGSREGLEATSQYREADAPSQVSFFEPESLSDQVARAVPSLQAQLRAYPTGMMGVLCPLNSDVKKVWDLLTDTHLRADIQLQMSDTRYSALDPARRILVASIHGAKGLEFRALHLLATEGITDFRTNKAKIAYTGVTLPKQASPFTGADRSLVHSKMGRPPLHRALPK